MAVLGYAPELQEVEHFEGFEGDNKNLLVPIPHDKQSNSVPDWHVKQLLWQSKQVLSELDLYLFDGQVERQEEGPGTICKNKPKLHDKHFVASFSKEHVLQELSQMEIVRLNHVMNPALLVQKADLLVVIHVKQDFFCNLQKLPQHVIRLVLLGIIVFLGIGHV